jgi:hypothetical protein
MTRLYRVFGSPEHAEQFLAGHIRFGHLGYYRTLEDDDRGDPGEGYGHHHEFRADRATVCISGDTSHYVLSPGMVAVHTECGNEVFICCLTAPPDDRAWRRVREELGIVVVEINDAERLRDEVYAALDLRDPWQCGAPIQLWPVDYRKGLELPVDSPLRTDPVRRAVTLKPPRYGYQHEHRLVLISFGTRQLIGSPPEFLCVDLPRPIHYARIL